jgi:hypothetical protein
LAETLTTAPGLAKIFSKSVPGGLLTIISAIVMILLFASEIRDYLTPQLTEELFVDTSRSGKLKINFDVVFSSISCDYLVSLLFLNYHKITFLLSKAQPKNATLPHPKIGNDCKQSSLFYKTNDFFDLCLTAPPPKKKPFS